MKRITSITLIFLFLVLAGMALPSHAVEAPKDAEAGQSAKPAADKAQSEDKQPADTNADGEKAAGIAGTVLLPSKGEYLWWVEDSEGKVVRAPVQVTADTIEWTAGEATLSVRILNSETGNVARIAAESAADEETRLVEKDFNVVRKLEVTVLGKDGNPVTAGVVELVDASDKTSTIVLEPQAEGKAIFQDIAAGKATISVSYGDEKVTQEISVSLERDTPTATTEVVIGGDVPTQAASDQPKETGGNAEESPAATRTVPNFVGILVSLILLGLVAGLLYYFLIYKSGLKKTLQKSGMQFEEDHPNAGLPGAEPEASQPPLDPDAIGPAPDAPPSAPVATAAPASGPRLVGLAGVYGTSVFTLSGQTMVAGREPTCDIALPDDSTTSRRHARFTVAGTSVTVHDEGSSNGTLVNGQKITEQALSPGDEVQIGSTRFRYEA